MSERAEWAKKSIIGIDTKLIDLTNKLMDLTRISMLEKVAVLKKKVDAEALKYPSHDFSQMKSKIREMEEKIH